MPLAPYQFTVMDEAGNVVPEAEIEVRLESTGALAALYENKAGTTPLGNSFNADENGYALFFLNPGEYRIDASASGFERTWRYVAINVGERYDLIWSATGAFESDEELPAIPVVVPLTLPKDLPGSNAFCDVAPTAEVEIVFKKKTGSGSWTDVFTVTFAIGEIAGTFTLAADATLSVNDRIRPFMPSSVDATFQGFSATIAALRGT